MKFEILLKQAQEGNPAEITEIWEMYKPLLLKNAIVEGVFDEELYHELVTVLLICIQRFRILE